METTVRLVKVIVFRNCDVSVLDIFFFGGGVPWTVDSPLQRAKQTRHLRGNASMPLVGFGPKITETYMQKSVLKSFLKYANQLR